jgi:hypothetical protein
VFALVSDLVLACRQSDGWHESPALEFGATRFSGQADCSRGNREEVKKNTCPGQDAWIEVDGGCAMQISMDEMMDSTE